MSFICSMFRLLPSLILCFVSVLADCLLARSPAPPPACLPACSLACFLAARAFMIIMSYIRTSAMHPSYQASPLPLLLTRISCPVYRNLLGIPSICHCILPRYLLYTHVQQYKLHCSSIEVDLIHYLQ
ncbi:hypothetical protein F5B22DRAFT_170199 [Xylaria bambusicola]|uniref:uncharacterized protein n=1 Tax=Xylaria bambusicola TaxID=326684 RepID=UPI0020079AB9|nr:uncharacterized protein F5B22DRAFT_170199 [Xylaria bambusicola]KAI0526656.1 hypothetical protein F5B22DRAFT_170199 [Xylaria bambusicola]